MEWPPIVIDLFENLNWITIALIIVDMISLPFKQRWIAKIRCIITFIITIAIAFDPLGSMSFSSVAERYCYAAAWAMLTIWNFDRI